VWSGGGPVPEQFRQLAELSAAYLENYRLTFVEERYRGIFAEKESQKRTNSSPCFPEKIVVQLMCYE
jgi:hypothetical protein